MKKKKKNRANVQRHHGTTGWRALRWRVYLVVLSVQEEVKCDEVVVMGWWFHVKDKAMDAVLHEGPQEPAHHKEQQKSVFMDQDGEVWEHGNKNDETTQVQWYGIGMMRPK